MHLKEGDILISNERHSCVVKFVEGVNEEEILLVDGIKDEVFYKEYFHLLTEKYKLLCNKEDRKDI